MRGKMYSNKNIIKPIVDRNSPYVMVMSKKILINFRSSSLKVKLKTQTWHA